MQEHPPSKTPSYVKSDLGFYPNRPMVTVAIATTLAGLNTSGLVSFGLAAYWGTRLLTDDALLYPIQSIRKNIREIYHGEKTTKNWIRLVASSLGFLLGIGLAHTLILKINLLTFMLAGIHQQMGCDLVTLAGLELAGMWMANLLEKPAYVGAIVALILLPFLPTVTLPALVDVYALCALSLTFAATLVAKHLTRLFYYLRYGHSNADGYYYNFTQSTPLEVSQRDHQIAERIGLTPQQTIQVTTLRIAILVSIKNCRQQILPWDRFWGASKAVTAETKNLLRALHHGSAFELRTLLSMVNIAFPDHQNLPKTMQQILYRAPQRVIATSGSRVTLSHSYARDLARLKHTTLWCPANTKILSGLHSFGQLSANAYDLSSINPPGHIGLWKSMLQLLQTLRKNARAQNHDHQMRLYPPTIEQ